MGVFGKSVAIRALFFENLRFSQSLETLVDRESLIFLRLVLGLGFGVFVSEVCDRLSW